MDEYCMYLRKSRADMEAERRGEGETLSRHRDMLTELAARLGLNVVTVYKEIVSGESISARPQMQKMLEEVGKGSYSGVIVAEIERLARGDTIDQGVVARTFRQSSTRIITPAKIYDPCNEFDEEFFEFSLFMSRREYKTIRRRMQAGRLAAVKEGNYIASAAPYGYRKIKTAQGIHTLEIIPEEAEVVRLIFEMRKKGHGAVFIAHELDRTGIRPQKSSKWEPSSIRRILNNPVYCGKLRWKSSSENSELYNGLHREIISKDDYSMIHDKKGPSVLSDRDMLNYYHGLAYCGCCGGQMRRRYVCSSGREYMLCDSYECRGKVVGSAFEAVDESVLACIRLLTSHISEPLVCRNSEYSCDERKNIAVRSELRSAERKLSRMYDLLEDGVYDKDIFNERSEELLQRIESLRKALDEEKRDVSLFQDIISADLHEVVESFPDAKPAEKNALINAAVSRIEYRKTARTYRNSCNDPLTLEIFFR